MITKPLLVLKKISLVAAVGYTIVLAAVCLMSLKDLPDLEISFADKIFHFLAYSLFSVLWYLAFFYTFSFQKKKAIIYAFVLAVLFGIIIEVLQDTMTVSRALDVYDVVANTLGALIASIVLWINKNLQVKNS